MPAQRPYIPMSVRVAVAERQVRESGSMFWPMYLSATWESEKNGKPWSLKRRLDVLLGHLFPGEKWELDHDPALELRERDGALYIPAANDPEHLIYRSTALHLMKTTGRRPGAERTVTGKGSDSWVAKKFRRLEGKNKRRPKQKISNKKKPWPKRPFGKQLAKPRSGKA